MNEPKPRLAAAVTLPPTIPPVAAAGAAPHPRRCGRTNEPKKPAAEDALALPPELVLALQALPMPRLRVPLAA